MLVHSTFSTVILNEKYVQQCIQILGACADYKPSSILIQRLFAHKTRNISFKTQALQFAFNGRLYKNR